MPTISEVRQKYPQYSDMSDQQLADALHAKYYADLPKDDFYGRIGLTEQASQTAPSPIADTALDVAKSAGVGAVKGINSLFGMPADVASFLGTLSATGLEKLVGFFSPEEGAKIRGAREALRKVDEANSQNSTFARQLGRLPGSDDLNKTTQAVFGEYYKPQTTPGEYAQTVAEFVAPAVGPGLVTKGGQALARLAGSAAPETAASLGEIAKTGLKYGAVPGVASEAAGQATEGSELEPYARAAAPLIAGGAMAARDIIGANRPLMEAFTQVKPEHRDAGLRLMEEAREAGTPITAAEALNQVSGGQYPRLLDYQRLAEDSKKGGDLFAGMMAERPEAARRLYGRVAGEVGPVPEAPFEIAPRVKEAASSRIAEEEAKVRAKARPYYEASRNEDVVQSLPEEPLTVVSAKPEKIEDQFTSQALQEAREYKSALSSRPGENLLQFIRRSGGINRNSFGAGDAREILQSVRNSAILRSEGGRNLDDMTELAWEAGFIGKPGERPEINELLDALEMQARGRNVYRVEDMIGMDVEGAEAFQKSLIDMGINPKQSASKLASELAEARRSSARDAIQERAAIIQDSGVSPDEALRLAEELHSGPAMGISLEDLDKMSPAIVGVRGANGQKLRLSSAYEDISSDPVFLQAEKELRGNPYRAKDIAASPPGTVGYLDMIKKQLDDKIRLFSDRTKEAYSPTDVRVIEPVRKRIVELADEASENYRNAREIYKEGVTSRVQPLQRAPTGQLADVSDIPTAWEQQAKILLGAKTAGSASQAAEAMATVMKADPEAGRSLARLYLEDKFDKTIKNLVSGENQWGAAKFANELVGSPKKREAFTAVMREVNPQAVPALDFMLKVFEAQGRRQARGSATASRTQATKELSESAPSMTLGAGASLMGGLNPFRTARDATDRLVLNRNMRLIAEVLTDPVQTEKIMKITRYAPQAPGTMLRLSNILNQSRVQYEQAKAGALPPSTE